MLRLVKIRVFNERAEKLIGHALLTHLHRFHIHLIRISIKRTLMSVLLHHRLGCLSKAIIEVCHGVISHLNFREGIKT